MALAISNASAFRMTVTPLGDKPDTDMKKVTVSRADVIVRENFEDFTDGTEDAPDWENPLASDYIGSNDIDPELTHGQQFRGHRVHMAGGCAALYNINVQDPAWIGTPKMDYSGTIKYSFLVKAIPTIWEEDGEKWHYKSSSIMVRLAGKDPEASFDIDGFDGVNFLEKPIYAAGGWHRVEIEFDNHTADNDAYLEIASAGHLLVDDIEVTQSIDNFIAPPVIKGVTAATEDSFTIAWTPVRTAASYYVYLYECLGYDEEGNPILKTFLPWSKIFTEDDLAYIESMGMTPEEYVRSMAEQMGMTYDEMMEMISLQEPDNNWDIVNHGFELKPEYSFTFEGLDPEKEYWYDVRSKYYRTFCDASPRPMDVVGTPETLEATNISKDSFTANWSKITKADGYIVDFYGVNRVEEDEENFIIFEEDFDAVDSLTDATDINNPDITGPESDIVFDDLTSTPGWTFGDDDHILLVKGKAGLGVDDYGCFRLTSPRIYVAGSDKATISMKVESTIPDYELRVRFAGVVYSLPVDGYDFEGEFVVPTLGMEETDFAISGPNEAPIFIDYFSVSQSLKAGDNTYTWLGNSEYGKDTLSCDFTDLDTEWFPCYAYGVRAFAGEGKSKRISFAGNRAVVDLRNGQNLAEIETVPVVDMNRVEVARYTLDGRQVNRPVKGINIVRYSDGSTRKVIVE